jgi:hypothetical protein
LGFFHSGRTADTPPDLAAAWHAAYQRNAARNLLLRSEQETIVSGLRAAGVAVLPVKGVSLAALLGDPSSRYSSDIDLAVKPQGLADAARVMRSMGFTFPLAESVLAEKRFVAAANESTAELGCVRYGLGGQLLVELHWRLYPGDAGSAWPVEVYPSGDEALSATHYFFYLCHHLAARGWTHLAKLCDAGDFLLRHAGRIDPIEFFRMAVRAGVTPAIRVTLEFLRVYFGLAWKHFVSDEPSRAAVAQRLRRPFLKQWEVSPHTYHRERMRFQQGLRPRMRYCAWLLQPTEREWAEAQGPVRSTGPLRLRRAARLAKAVLAAAAPGELR